MVGNSTTPICQYSMSTFYCLQNISGEVSSFHVWIFFVDNFQESLVLVLILYDQSFKMSQIHQIYLRKNDILKLCVENLSLAWSSHKYVAQRVKSNP